MRTQYLIDAIVRQTTVLIAQLATTGGVRAPLSHIAGQVFLDLAREIESQGVSRKVSADMFGLALRTYQRRTQRLRESATMRGRSLWEAVFDYLSSEGMVSRDEVLRRFRHDDEATVRGVLHDLTESGLLFCSGTASSTTYRAASEDEIGRMRSESDAAALDSLLWATIYQQGPLSRDALLGVSNMRAQDLDAALARLIASGRIEQQGDSFTSPNLLIPLDSPIGWEAAVLDHVNALMRTVAQKLQLEPTAKENDVIGGSTYTFTVWPGHPHEQEVLQTLAKYRELQSELRKRVDTYNEQHGLPPKRTRVVSYTGQCLTDEEEGTQ